VRFELARLVVEFAQGEEFEVSGMPVHDVVGIAALYCVSEAADCVARRRGIEGLSIRAGCTVVDSHH